MYIQPIVTYNKSSLIITSNVVITSSWVEGPDIVVLTRPEVSKVHSRATVSPGISILASAGME